MKTILLTRPSNEVVCLKIIEPNFSIMHVYYFFKKEQKSLIQQTHLNLRLFPQRCSGLTLFPPKPGERFLQRCQDNVQPTSYL